MAVALLWMVTLGGESETKSDEESISDSEQSSSTNSTRQVSCFLNVNVITDFTVGEDLIGLADAASLGIASVENLTQQAKEGGLLLSSFNDPLVFLQEVTAPLREDSFLFSQTIVV
jgi:hypothetical protein